MSIEFGEDQPGWGHFRVEIETAGEKAYEGVPVLNLFKTTPSRFVESQFKEGRALVAFRNGGWGTCTVLVNPEKVVAERVTTFSKFKPMGPDVEDPNSMTKQEIIGNDVYQAIIISPVLVNIEPEKAEISGRLKEGKLPFKAKVYFVSSY